MREQVFRERRERVAHLEAIGKITGRLFGLDTARAFGDIIAAYESEIFQEDYDADLLRRKVNALREAQARIKKRRTEDMRQLSRLERMGAYYDKEFGPDLKPVNTKK